jgi:hypothetical protein
MVKPQQKRLFSRQVAIRDNIKITLVAGYFLPMDFNWITGQYIWELPFYSYENMLWG